ncbi:unnamed protein product [Parascedosporium putredinis]|uniref:tRNA-dihydrouridine(47) synthase [NAD(P)(+)] n=1 Tax=Parascedosporium putredinis TaxID=1442378 RepID=A0A9P1HAS1_9PEZI|nr:unnamed protein product [Parascedosporium putredinis]CAI8002070.1 unnamed protein product [Parascedosporium putredinis]
MAEHPEPLESAQQPALPEALAMNQTTSTGSDGAPDERPSKRLKTAPDNAPDAAPTDLPSITTAASEPARDGNPPTSNGENGTNSSARRYLVKKQELSQAAALTSADSESATGEEDGRVAPTANAPASASVPDSRGKGKKERGQNVGRSYGRFEESIQLCASRAMAPEFSPDNCQFGDKCRLCHNLREYLEARPKDTSPETGTCPLYEVLGRCPAGFKCRFAEHHMMTYEHPDGRQEMVLTEKKRPPPRRVVQAFQRVDFKEADQFCNWLDHEAKIVDKLHNQHRMKAATELDELRAQFVDPPFLPSEKRRLYFGPETPALAPLTTQGNLPFRRLCVELGCEITYSEMAMSGPLLQAPNMNPTASPIVQGYDNSRDMRFGAQISGHSHRMVTRAANILNRYCPSLRVIDLNCGCPIDMVYKAGAGAGILDSKSKLERMVRGMNAVSGEIPITVKLRTGVQSSRPVASTIIGNLAFGAREHRDRLGAPGCAAVTLHGRSREQRYTKKADWSYIAECATLVKTYNAQVDLDADTSAEPDARTLPNSKGGKMYFLGNGDCYSHHEYYSNVEKSEIKARQYLDKSSAERLEYVKKYVDYGLEAWGSDDIGVGYTRRFLLEWLSFAHRYVPIGLLEYLPPI